ncbi:fucose-specific lectin [Nemania diffusa]|nr:fucose-specific lectin [Nemania diffusa]
MAELIANHTGIAAVNYASHLRVYATTVDGSVVESQFEGKWTGGVPPRNTIGHGKILTPVSATNLGHFNSIRVYFLDSRNQLQEAAWDSGKGWYTGALSNQFTVAPFSSVAGTFISEKGSDLRVYAQLPDLTIQEFVYTPGSQWAKGASLGRALAGTDITVVCNRAAYPNLKMRVYFQDPKLNIVEKAYDSSTGWYEGQLSLASSIPRCSLGAVSWNDNSFHIRVYYGVVEGSTNRIREMCWDGRWAQGQFNQPCIPGSQVAAISLSAGDLRAYLQNGYAVTAVSEWATGASGWAIGTNIAGEYS